MRALWIAGILHAFIGTTMLFLTLHPLRDALDAHALDLTQVGAAWQALNGLALMVIAAVTAARIPGLLIAGGTAISMLTLYFIIFTGERPLIIVLAPIGGAIGVAGWVGLLFAKLRS